MSQVPAIFTNRVMARRIRAAYISAPLSVVDHGKRRADVCGSDPPRHHPVCEYRGHLAHLSDVQSSFGEPQVIPIPKVNGVPDLPLDIPALERSLRHPRTFFSSAMSVLACILTLLAVVPLASVLYMLIVRGGHRLSLTLFTELPPAAGMAGGGIGNALLGTF